jgi:hypothetical protein
VLRDTLSSHGDGGIPGASAPSIASCLSESDLIFPVVSVCFFPRSWDPMVEEAALGITIAAPCCSCQEEIYSRRGGVAGQHTFDCYVPMFEQAPPSRRHLDSKNIQK